MVAFWRITAFKSRSISVKGVAYIFNSVDSESLLLPMHPFTGFQYLKLALYILMDSPSCLIQYTWDGPYVYISVGLCLNFVFGWSFGFSFSQSELRAIFLALFV